LGQYEYPGEETKEPKRKTSKTDESKIFFGGNFGLSLWGEYVYVELSPLIGYKITRRLWAGAGPKYMFIKQSSYYQSSIYGIKTFGSFAVLDKINEVTNIGIGSIFLYTENEILSIEPLLYNSPISGYYKGARDWYDILMAGVGFRFPLGQRLGLSVIVLWGLTESAQLLYSNPEIRLSIDY
jgi:hypothetical protein